MTIEIENLSEASAEEQESDSEHIKIDLIESPKSFHSRFDFDPREESKESLTVKPLSFGAACKQQANAVWSRINLAKEEDLFQQRR